MALNTAKSRPTKEFTDVDFQQNVCRQNTYTSCQIKLRKGYMHMYDTAQHPILFEFSRFAFENLIFLGKRNPLVNRFSLAETPLFSLS